MGLLFCADKAWHSFHGMDSEHKQKLMLVGSAPWVTACKPRYLGPADLLRLVVPLE